MAKRSNAMKRKMKAKKNLAKAKLTLVAPGEKAATGKSSRPRAWKGALKIRNSQMPR